MSRSATLSELWAGVLIGPVAALTQLEINYALVLWACSHSRSWPLHLVSLLLLGFTVFAGFLAYKNWRRLADLAAEDSGDTLSRSRFMAAVGTLISAYMALVIAAQWVPVFIYGPCQR
ncbi:MAG: hypothetical protein DMF69_04725 [Acidobacteria bacterium]|nr:MAG: hypothetical protein DMF69_04725 [Acidobacteriota bacterium]